MIAPPERSPERDAALEAMLPNVPFDGWTYRALRLGLASIGVPADEAELLFPGGSADMIEAFCDLADRRMEEAAADQVMGDKLPQRVRAVIALRLVQNRPYKEAVRRAVAVLALPRNVRLACDLHGAHGRCDLARGGRSLDGFHLVHQAGDPGARPIPRRCCYWLRDSGEDDAATLAFLDRRMAGIAWTHRLRRRADAVVERVTSRMQRFTSRGEQGPEATKPTDAARSAG